MNKNHPLSRQKRARGAYLVVALFMGALLFSFFRVQVLRSDTWELKAESNRLRQLPSPAPRGTIYDRNGRILADNVPGYTVTLPPGPADSIRGTLERMSKYVDLPPERIEELMRSFARYRRELVVDTDASFETVSALEERRAEFPDVYVEMRPRRRYPAGKAIGHLMGYVGEITGEELGADVFSRALYDQGMIVGKTGIELEYERRLQGKRGLRYVEVDAKGRIVGDFAGFRTVPGEAGESIKLNIDLDLMEWIYKIWPKEFKGSVVALDPADGGVLALFSYPSYDPNDFVGGIDPKLWQELNEDEDKPLYHRAVLGKYAPASTWKLATAGIGLDAGVIDPDQVMPIPCTGSMFYGNRTWRCWNRSGHGFNNLERGIANSCDVYFYQLGLKITLDRLLEKATDIGFSQKCGIDLPQENAGTFPANREFWVNRFGYSPQEGEVLSLSIGQGPNSQTPLKMAQFYLALARDGSAPAPALAQGVELAEGWSLDLAPEHLDALREGLRAVTLPGGTAHVGTALEYWDVLGKTGTGQNPLSLQGLADDHAWFAGMAGPPGEAPEIVVVVMVEYGRSGSGTASPIMAKTADYYLRKKHGIPIDSVQTYRDYLNIGRQPPWYARRFYGGR